ncbi:DUF4962 domain-containing protein [Leptospira sp. GIMC2001]|uniref:DUF4962 domain-containing protein n=1 Tax=Leptospira sp. GIMC2001 TaxID=1513297 RepID=UPI00234A13DF|nr:DUF4962 domain-containing protein [Leptospira sp. GIMC2001]WCL50042.1 DUF4962 domain-containing protein [Leptospira sp. GIMC2001]
MEFYKKKENKVLLFLIFNAIIFLILFFYDLNKKIGIGDREIIGTVEFKKNTVQRKLSDHMVWESLDQNSPVANGDTIRSESFSDAIIRLNDGTEINLDENSMFFLDISEADPTIEFTQGSIQVRKKDGSGNENLKIQSQNKTIQIQNGELNIQRGDDGEFRMLVEKGNATVKSAGNSTTVGSGKQANLSGDKIEVTKIPFQLTEPLNNAVIPAQTESKNIQFSWKANENYSKIKLEISRNPQFKSLVKSLDFPSQKTDVSLPLGTYYWRINSDKGTSATYRFHIFKEEDITLRFPENDSQISFVEKLPLVSFQWSRDQFTRDYILEISESSNFKVLSSRHVTQTNSFSVDNLSSGKYYWRVRCVPYSANLPEKISKPRSFSIQKTNSFSAPTIARPNNERMLVSNFATQGILIWNTSSELVSFKVTLAKDSNFKNNVFETTTQRNFLQPTTKLGSGTYYWKVVGFSASGKASESSQIANFTLVDKAEDLIEKVEKTEEEPVKVPSKLLISPVDTVVDLSGESSISFKWNKEESGFIYILSIFQENTGKKVAIHQVKTKETSYKLSDLSILDEGKFIWEVSSMSGSKLIRKESAKFIISLTKLKSLRPSDIEFISPSVLYKDGSK